MIIPYSTDAPIYHFPWMTIGLIVVNSITFAITVMGFASQGWLLTYGNGLHPLEWVAYNFLHFGPFHLIGNMFFLWAFGIVVEGKLGWWKFLLVYLSIGVLGGALIQTAMLGYIKDEDLVARDGAIPGEVGPGQAASKHAGPFEWLWIDNSLYAQDLDFDAEMNEDEPLRGIGIPHVGADAMADGRLPNAAGDQAVNEPLFSFQAGAGGASLVIYGLMAIVLIWAPRNEIHCLWIGMRSGTFEFEYLYFCGFYIVIEVLSAVFSARGFEATSEVGHAVGAMLGGGLGVLFVKQKWVDCENWDLFSIMQGKQLAVDRVGDWHRSYMPSSSERRDSITALSENAPDQSESRDFRKKKKKAKPKLVELDSLDDPLESDNDVSIAERTNRPQSRAARNDLPPLPPIPPPRASIPDRFKNPQKALEGIVDPVARIRQLLFEEEIVAALEQFRQCREADKYFRLPQEELRMLANEMFKRRAVPEAAALLEEYIQRFQKDAAKQRVKLAVLYVKYLRRPTGSLKLLAAVDAKSLPDDYQGIYRTAAREAQRMVAEGVTDANA